MQRSSLVRALPLALPVLAALGLAACDSGQASQQGSAECRVAAAIILDGAKCVMRQAGAPPLHVSFDPRVDGEDLCERRVREFREWGLGAYDAEEILRTDLDAYFKKFRRRPFCAELRVQQNFGYSLKR